MDKITRSSPLLHLKGFKQRSLHAKCEFSISYGSNVIAEVTV